MAGKLKPPLVPSCRHDRLGMSKVISADRLLETRCLLGEDRVQLAPASWRGRHPTRRDPPLGSRSRLTPSRCDGGARRRGRRDDGGTLIAACRTGLRHVEAGDGPGQLVIPLPPGDADLRKNDGKADPAGRFVGGTMTLGDPLRLVEDRSWSYSDGGPSSRWPTTPRLRLVRRRIHALLHRYADPADRCVHIRRRHGCRRRPPHCGRYPSRRRRSRRDVHRCRGGLWVAL